MGSGRIRRNGLIIVGLMVAVAALLSSCSQTAKYSENVQSSALFGDLVALEEYRRGLLEREFPEHRRENTP